MEQNEIFIEEYPMIKGKPAGTTHPTGMIPIWNYTPRHLYIVAESEDFFPDKKLYTRIGSGNWTERTGKHRSSNSRLVPLGAWKLAKYEEKNAFNPAQERFLHKFFAPRRDVNSIYKDSALFRTITSDLNWFSSKDKVITMWHLIKILSLRMMEECCKFQFDDEAIQFARTYFVHNGDHQMTCKQCKFIQDEILLQKFLGDEHEYDIWLKNNNLLARLHYYSEKYGNYIPTKKADTLPPILKLWFRIKAKAEKNMSTNFKESRYPSYAEIYILKNQYTILKEAIDFIHDTNESKLIIFANPETKEVLSSEEQIKRIFEYNEHLWKSGQILQEKNDDDTTLH